MIRALDVSGLDVSPAMGAPVPYLAAIAALLLAAVALAALAVRLSRPRAGRRTEPRGVHASAGSREAWRARIDDVTARYEAGDITDRQAFAELAALVRAFASETTGTDMRASTLADIAVMPRSGDGIDLLRHTVAALYPPEFADALTNAQARGTDVAQAAEWVRNLVERWR
ncbi:hypothetical protein G1C96_0516 [Bifidobacterium sp. DSM 109958]|uniref:Uncharacterized protein n=1 Tax=Bifidobacterium moraviense TaxID=2675323 RepID=A0A7Y0F0V6_9BIFI|nr:hypothetical protein [Bifidobacterium sp. DSM 109958]NMM99938.1 hypothetical protein [Bifidobacterium sp. DSM 109958]